MNEYVYRPRLQGKYDLGIRKNVFPINRLEEIRTRYKSMYPGRRIVVKFRGPRPHSPYHTIKEDARMFAIYVY